MTVAATPAFTEPVTVVAGVNTYTYDFDAYLPSDVKVQVTTAAGAISYLAYETDYTVTPVALPAYGGTVTVSLALVPGSQVVLFRDTGLAQMTKLPNQGPFFAQTVERALDRLTMVTQDQAREADLSLSYPVGSLANARFPVPVPGKAVVGRLIGGIPTYVSDGPDVADLNAAVAATAADRVQTGLDRAQTGQDVVTTGQNVTAAVAAKNTAVAAADAAVTAAAATAADRVQTGLDRTATGQDKTATAADRVQTGLDRTATGQDKTATAADRVQTGLDRTATGQDRVATGQDKTATAADRVQTGQDRAAASASAAAAKLSENTVAMASVPAGAIIMRFGPLQPGFIAWGEGGTFDRTTYPALATWLDNNGASLGLTAPQIAAGTIPDWRDYSPRTAGGALGPALGAKQEDAMQGHTHNFTVYQNVSGGSGSIRADTNTANPVLNGTSTPVSDGTNGTPRTATETRVKSFGVRWQIKAFGAAVDQGTVVISALAASVTNLENHAVRDDQDQNALAKLAVNKINILKNTLQRFEVIEEVNISSAVASYVRTGLSAYSQLKFEGYIRGDAANSYSAWQVSTDNGASWVTSNYFRTYNQAQANGGSFGSSNNEIGFIGYGGGSNDPSFGGSVVSMRLQNFNKANKYKMAQNQHTTYTQDGAYFIAGVSSSTNSTQPALNALRLIMASGNLVEVTGVLSGMRG